MTFQIDKGVPVPESKRGIVRFPFADMEIDDSFLVPYNGVDRGNAQRRLINAARHYARDGEGGWRFTTRTEDEGVRVWKVAL